MSNLSFYILLHDLIQQLVIVLFYHACEPNVNLLTDYCDVVVVALKQRMF